MTTSRIERWTARVPGDAWGVVLVWSALALLPVGRVVEGSVAAMALAGVYLLVKRRGVLLADGRVRLFSAVFLAMWIPMVLSLPDSVRPSTTIYVVVNHLRFYLGGLFIVWALSDDAAWERLLRWSAWLLTFWVADGLLQTVIGRDLFGFEVDGNRINALFGQGAPKYAIALAAFAPLAWEHAFRRWSVPAHAALVLATVVVVVGAGTRSAWITIAVVLSGHLAAIGIRNPRRARNAAFIAIAGAAVAGLIFYQLSDRFEQRVDDVVGIVVNGANAQSNAINHRFWIWRGAWNMFRDHPVNGAGARTFRYAFADHAHPDDPFMARDPPLAPAHSHQLLLEVAAESGGLGLLGLLLAAWWIGRSGWRSLRDGPRWFLAPGLCLLGATFPFNTHQAVYSAFWSQVLWWLVAVSCAACQHETAQGDLSVSGAKSRFERDR